MAKFRTKIAHKKGSEIEVNGHVIPLNPDSDPGICEFEVPDARDDVFARLLEIPEGFELLEDTQQPDASAGTGESTGEQDGGDAPLSLVLEGPNGEKVDLYTADKATLLQIGKDLGLSIPGATGLEKVRAQVIAAFKATAQV